MLEILVVIVLIAAMGGLTAMVMTGGLEGIRLRASAKEIATQLRFTRAQAIATGQPQRFSIDPQAHVWSAARGRQGKVPAQLGIQVTSARQVQPARGVAAIMFFADGASTGGRIQLRAKRAAWNVDVAWLTGRVEARRVEGALQ